MPPHSVLLGYDEQGQPILGGAGFKAADEILSRLGISYTTKFIKGFTGVPLGNGSWTGVYGALQRDEADLGIACHIPSFERSKVVDLSAITAQGDSFIYGSVGPAESTDIGAIIKIFSPMVWIALLSSMLLLVAVHGLTVSNENGENIFRFVERSEWYKIFSDYIAALFFEGTPRDPTTSRRRFLYGLWWMTLLVLGNGFCGHTRAMMMAPKENFRVRDLEHLSTVTNKITPMALRDSVFETFFTTGNAIERKISRSLMLVKDISAMFSMEKLMMLKKGKGVILLEGTITKNRIGVRCKEAKVDIYNSKDPFLSSYCYMVWRKELEQDVRKMIDQRIRWLFEGHLINKWLDDECRLFERCKAANTQPETENPLTLKDMSDLFVLNSACLTITFLFFLVEVIEHRFFKSRADRVYL